MSLPAAERVAENVTPEEIAQLDAAYRDWRRFYASQCAELLGIGIPYPKRKRRHQHPAPGVFDLDADEVAE